ncbi:DUF4190 domain-containing protein [Demequina phytophila]|uniref:DUF4190 domain-containing protein n=1 Tax=Demequina phytophila TaxID=1638981 RepID=UPI0007816B4E|nr:DUF4190 domain-containing protein [Demequina phytophila]
MSTPQEPFDPAAPRPIPPYAQQAPQPAPQPAYPQAPYAPQRPAGTDKNWMGVTSLVLSLAGLFTGITAIVGIVFGHLSLSAVKRGEADNWGVGLAGLIIGYVITALGLLVLIGLFAVFGWAVSECGGSNAADWCTSTGS